MDRSPLVISNGMAEWASGKSVNQMRRFLARLGSDHHLPKGSAMPFELDRWNLWSCTPLRVLASSRQKTPLLPFDGAEECSRTPPTGSAALTGFRFQFNQERVTFKFQRVGTVSRQSQTLNSSFNSIQDCFGGTYHLMSTHTLLNSADSVQPLMQNT